MLGEGHADHIHHADNHAHGQQQNHQDQYRRRSNQPATVRALMRVYRWLGLPLQHKGGDAHRQQQRRHQGPGFWKHRHAQPHRYGRADDEAHLIEYRLQGKRGLQPGLATVQLGPARPHHSGHIGHAARQRGEQKQRPIRRLQPRTQQQHQ